MSAIGMGLAFIAMNPQMLEDPVAFFKSSVTAQPIADDDANEIIQNAIDNSEENISIELLHLTQFPEKIFTCKRLHKLTIGSCLIPSLPAKIGELRRLRALHLMVNNLQELPREIGRLYHLTILDVSGNELHELPREIANLTLLEDLCASDNQLTVLPQEIGALTRLKSLNLSRNRLTILPDELGQLSSLRYLYLERNPDLRELPQTLCLGNLDILRTDSNQADSESSEE